jgi:quercetin dioxygenase-like cupin family protein
MNKGALLAEHGQDNATRRRAVPMEFGKAIILDSLVSVEMDLSQPVIYDQEIGVRLLYEDPDSGAEHYLIRYPGGLHAQVHRHTAAHTIVVLKGRLAVNDEVIGPGAYCHFPAGETMFHAPVDDDGCLFVTLFHGPFDVEPLTHEAMPQAVDDTNRQ